MRLQHGDGLNAPWGVALAPLDFGLYSLRFWWDSLPAEARRNRAATSRPMTSGQAAFKGLLEDTSGNPLAINDVWGISFGNTSPNNFDSVGAPSAEMYFAAGPNHATGGAFGYVTAAELIEGNDQ